MCIGFFKVAKSPTDKYKLIVFNNRDEVLDRKTAKLHWHDGILSGVDMQDVAKGTWLGINEVGRIGMLLSITQPPDSKHENAPSRGAIPTGFLTAENPSEFLENLKTDAHNYNGFQFVTAEKWAEPILSLENFWNFRNAENLFDIQTLTNRLVKNVEIEKYDDEILVFSNSPPHIPFKKTEHGKKLFAKKMKNSNSMEVDEIFNALLKVGTDRTSCFPDPQISEQTGIDSDHYKPLTSIFIRFPNERRYGTRCHTMILVDQNDLVTVIERRMIVAADVEKSTWCEEYYNHQL